jgi:integrase
MLRLIKKHLAACKKRSEKDWKCQSKDERRKVSCPFYIVGPDPRDPTAPRIKHHTGTSSEQIARAKLVEFENGLFNPQKEPQEQPKTILADAVEMYLTTKRFLSEDRQRKLRRELNGMVAHLVGASKVNASEIKDVYVTDIKKTDLEAYMYSWSGATSVLKTKRENMKSFWLWCQDSELIAKNISAKLGTVGDPRKSKTRRIPVLTTQEIKAILLALDTCHEVFVKEGENVAKQVRAFTYIERYTGMAVGDVAKLRKDEVVGNEILVNRKKTGELVFTAVPDFVVSALNDMTADSEEYFFWSGNGKLHTRTSKWGKRLQKLYVHAGVRVSKVRKKRRSGGVLKGTSEEVEVSSITPHYWRHTFVRDHYIRQTPIEVIADLIGDDPKTVQKYYSSFDELRQRKLIEHQQAFWNADPYALARTGHHAAS